MAVFQRYSVHKSRPLSTILTFTGVSPVALQAVVHHALISLVISFAIYFIRWTLALKVEQIQGKCFVVRILHGGSAVVFPSHPVRRYLMSVCCPNLLVPRLLNGY